MRQNEIRDLEVALKEAEDAIIPKEKFGFKNKKPPTSAPVNVKVVDSPKIDTPDGLSSVNLSEVNMLFTLNIKSSIAKM
jgi:hypothetical protein